MTTPFWNHVARLPRHSVEHNRDSITEIIHGDKDTQVILSVELINLSRNGAQVELDRPLGQGESVIIRIHCKESEMELQFPATICWQRSESEELWSIGCQFKEEITWEVYGELFLEGVLESDYPADENSCVADR